MNDRLIQVNEQEVASTTLAQVRQASVDPEIIALASAFFAGGGITKEAAVRAAYYVKTTGEVEGRDFYVGTAGNVAGKLIEGYQGIQDRVGRRYQLRYHAPSDAERALYGIREDDHAMICECYVHDDMVAWQAIGFPYEPVVGYCAFAKGDKPRVPTGRNLDWVLRKSARKDALRQVPGAPDEDDPVNILKAAEERGLRIGFNQEKRKYLTSDQAERLVEDAEAQAKRAARPEAEMLVEAVRNAAHQHKMAYEGRMGMAERCPDCGTELPDHTDACKWFDFAPRYGDIEDIPTHDEEHAAPTTPTPSTPGTRITAAVRMAADVYDSEHAAEFNEDDRKRARVALAKLLPGDDNSPNRQAIRQVLFGKVEYADLSPGECMALKKFCDVRKQVNPDDPAHPLWIPSELALQKVKLLLAEIPQPAEEVAP